jgi:uncharacterized tellurite resistance protein B-like protein
MLGAAHNRAALFAFAERVRRHEMLDRFLNFLKAIPAPQRDAPDDDPRVAAAALLFHLMDADGVRERSEAAQLRLLMSEMFGITGAELERVISAGEKADEEAVDLYSFTSVINRRLDQPAKCELIAIMWDMVFADGEVHELEDNLVWRVAELIHVEREQRIALRQRARAEAGA